MNKSNESLENRVRRLERMNHLLMISCIALASVPVLIGAGGQTAVQPKVQLPPGQLAPQVPLPLSAQKYMSKQIQDMMAADRQIHNVLRTRVLALVDGKGKTRAYLSTDERGNPMLAMFGEVNADRHATSLTLGLADNKAQCVMYDLSERPRLSLLSYGSTRAELPEVSLDAGGLLQMRQSNGNELAKMEAGSSIFELTFNHPDGKKAASLASRSIASAQLPPGSRMTSFTIWSQGGPTANMACNVGLASIAVTGNPGYAASLYAEGYQAFLSGRCKSGPQDQVFRSKWRDPLHPDVAWLVNPGEPP